MLAPAPLTQIERDPSFPPLTPVCSHCAVGREAKMLKSRFRRRACGFRHVYMLPFHRKKKSYRRLIRKESREYER